MQPGKVSTANQYTLQKTSSGIALETLKKSFPDTGALSQSNPTTSPIATAVGIQTVALNTPK